MTIISISYLDTPESGLLGELVGVDPRTIQPVDETPVQITISNDQAVIKYGSLKVISADKAMKFLETLK